MGSLRAMLVIAAKDIAQRSRDRSAYIMGVLGPLVLALIMGATLGGDDVSAFELGVADEDGGQLADDFRGTLAGLETDRIVEITQVDSLAELERLVDDGDVAAGFHLGSGLTDAVTAGEPAQIIIVGDPGSPVGTDVAEAVATTFAAEVDYVSLATEAVLTTEGATTDSDRIAELTAAALAEPRPIDLVAMQTDGRGDDLATYYAVSLAVFFLFFTVQFGVLSLTDEREGGTLDRILMAPIPKSAVIVGKLTSSMVFGVLSMVVLVVATTLIGGAEWGDPLAVGVLILVGVLVAIAVASLVVAVVKTADQAVALGWGLALVFGVLGGTFFPVSRAGGLLSTVSYASPHRWLLEAFRDVSYGAELADLGLPLAVLCGFALIVGGAGLASANRGLVR